MAHKKGMGSTRNGRESHDTLFAKTDGTVVFEGTSRKRVSVYPATN